MLRQANTPSRHRRSERGSVHMIFLVSASLLLIFGTFALSLGQVYVGHSHLQVIADSAARAAVAMIRDGNFPLAARDMASIIALRTEAIEPGIFLSDGDVAFGDYEHASRTFTQGGNEFAPAVRVIAGRNQTSVMGPLQLAVGVGYGANDYDLEATSIATFGCREVVFAIDASGGMEEEFATALTILKNFKDEMLNNPQSGDKLGLTFYAGRAATLQEFAQSGSPFWAGGTPDPLTTLLTDPTQIDFAVTAYTNEGVCDRFRDRLPGGGRGSCGGKGDHLAIDSALQLFDDMDTGSCSISRERLIVLLTSDLPCAVWGPAVGDFTTPYYGGTRDDAIAAADRADALGVSIAPVHVRIGQPGANGWCENKPLAYKSVGLPQLYLNSLARGFVTTSVRNPVQSDIEDLLDGLNKNLTVRVVQ